MKKVFDFNEEEAKEYKRLIEILDTTECETRAFWTDKFMLLGELIYKAEKRKENV